MSALNIILAVALRAVLPRRRRGPMRVVLFGHHFNGNLRAFYERAGRSASDLDCRFVYIDHRQYRARRTSWPALMSVFRIDHMVWVAGADVFVSDRGPSVFQMLLRLRQLPWVEVWHGVGYKGFSEAQYGAFREVTRFLAASESDRLQWHCRGAGPPLERIAVTGYARTDPLVKGDVSASEVVTRLGLDAQAVARVMVAPTWQQDEAGRSIIPFGLSEEEFFGGLERWGNQQQVELVFRAHLNTDFVPSGGYRRIVFWSLQDHPITEELLWVTDVLVTDWSSIVSDFLVLDRPVVFLDVPAPFRHDFGNLDAGDRPGYLVDSWSALLASLEEAVLYPERWRERFGQERLRVLEKAFGETLDGQSSQRYLAQLRRSAGERS